MSDTPSTALHGMGRAGAARRPLVAVFGSGDAPPDDLARARALGAALASAGYGVLNGGYGGTMEAAAEGAAGAGGHVVGVTCAEFTFRSGPNRWCGEVVEAATLAERLGILVRRADAWIVLPGGNGTLAELSMAWEHLRKGLVGDRPLVAWEVPWRRVLAPLLEGPYVPGGERGIAWVDSVEDAVAAIRAGVPAAPPGAAAGD